MSTLSTELGCSKGRAYAAETAGFQRKKVFGSLEQKIQVTYTTQKLNFINLFVIICIRKKWSITSIKRAVS